MNAEIDHYIEQRTERNLTHGYLRYAVIASSAVAFLAVVGLLFTVFTAGSRHAYVVRLAPDGSTKVASEGSVLAPQPQDLKWFLERFCRYYFSRDPATLQNLPEMEWYFSPELWDQALAVIRHSKSEVLGSQSNVQVDAWVPDGGIHLSKADNETYEAYIQVNLTRSTNGREMDPQKATTYIRFTCLACQGKRVDDKVWKTNPLGFEIENIPMLSGEK